MSSRDVVWSSEVPYWTKERVFEAFRNWEIEHGSLPSTTDWRRSGGELHPTDRLVYKLFGGWTQALVEYDKKPRTRTPPNFWDREKVIASFQAWAERHDGKPPVILDTLRGRNDGTLPTSSTVERYCGSWANALRAAGFYPIPRGLTRHAIERYKPLPRRGS